jgi:hypothetical protein
MEELYIEATKSSPEIIFNPENLTLTIKGESYPENSFVFYKPIFELVENVINQNNNFKLIIIVSYLNTSSTKSFMNLLDIAEEGYQNEKNISIDWYYEEDNEHSYELALDFKEYLELPFNIIPLN